MNSSVLLSVSTFVYGLSALLYLTAMIFGERRLASIGKYTAFSGVLTITCGIILRWFESYNMGIGHAPLSNLYESLVFFSLVLTSIYLFFEKKCGSMFVGSFVMPIAFFSITYASLSPNINSAIQPLIPALQSNWLITHVVTCFIGYAAFTISFGLSTIYIFKARNILSLLVRFSPKLHIIEQRNYQIITFGFLFLSVGIITGSVWANSAWGSYWSWDPKETWSLITWLIYATLIHIRLITQWKGEKLSYISIIGFISVLFTYFGVNYLHGLHSYA